MADFNKNLNILKQLVIYPLLSILLRTGLQGQNAIALAREMIGEFDGLNGLRAATSDDLLSKIPL